MWTKKDLVEFKESVRKDGGDAIIKVGHGETVTVREAVTPWAYIRPAGMDFAEGFSVTAPRRLTGRETALIAAMNRGTLTVAKRSVVALIPTGDELVNPVYNLVRRAVNAGVKKIVIADPERSTFFEMAQRCEDKFCADIIEWRTRKPVTASGALMVLENA